VSSYDCCNVLDPKLLILKLNIINFYTDLDLVSDPIPVSDPDPSRIYTVQDEKKSKLFVFSKHKLVLNFMLKLFQVFFGRL